MASDQLQTDPRYWEYVSRAADIPERIDERSVGRVPTYNEIHRFERTENNDRDDLEIKLEAQKAARRLEKLRWLQQGMIERKD